MVHLMTSESHLPYSVLRGSLVGVVLALLKVVVREFLYQGILEAITMGLIIWGRGLEDKGPG